MVEVELKFPVDSLAVVRDAVMEQGAKLSHVSQQVDEYFSHPTHDFLEKDLALRIRSVGKNCWLTFKGPNQDKSASDAAKIRDEIELELGDTPSAEKMKAILVGCGFFSVAFVNKQREVLEWTQQETTERIEICLDEVEGLGSFVELEIIVDCEEDAQAAAKAKQRLLDIAESLELSNPITTTYLELLMQT